MPGTGKACANCNTKKVGHSYWGEKQLAGIIISSEEEGAMLRPKKAKMSGLVPKAGEVSVMVGKLTDRSANILDAIWQQNSLLSELLGLQQQTVIAMRLQAEWARPMTRYMGQIAQGLEAQNEEMGSGGSGGSASTLGEKKDKGIGRVKEQEEKAKNGSRNGDGDRDGNKEGDKDVDGDADADGDETMGKSL
jgi:hypothetical protein